jgi:mannosyltransferase OCH1-like enzyme
MSVKKILFTSYTCDESDPILQKILTEWKELNPEYQIKYFSDSDVKKFFKNTPQYKTYSKMKNGVAIADFFRICYINKFGGYWFDLDVQPINLKLPKSGDVQLFDAGFGNISYMFIGGNPNQKLFSEVIEIVEKNINNNIPIKREHVINITGPRVIQNIICGLFNVTNQDGWLVGDEHPRVGFEGDVYEFIYTKVPFPKLKTERYEKLQQKYNKQNYQQYNYL